MKYLWNPIQVIEHSLQGKNFGGGHKVKAHVGIGGSLEKLLQVVSEHG